jgi:transcriptional regulator with XRE-family HTH domain
MKERILEFLRNENKSSAQLAEEIGVQASGISHILSGRNNPSLDFILKMLEKYQFLSTDWLLFGRGSMYKDSKMQTLFDYDVTNDEETSELSSRSRQTGPTMASQNLLNTNQPKDESNQENKIKPDVLKIVWFYEDNSFEEFIPHR